MDRRKFLKILGVGAGSSLLPVEMLKAVNGCVEEVFKNDTFDPTQEYGNAIDCVDGPFQDHPATIDLLKQYLREDLNRIIPLKYQKYVTVGVTTPYDYGRRKSVYWYYRPPQRFA